ncbi:MAG: DUF4214 domain-containing protein [Clostridiales bacterium]|nr:DUF4214 domain-containing protein [Clostridiales bacterium]
MRKLKLFSSVIAATILASSMIFSLPANVNAADKDINSTFPDEVFRNWVKNNADQNKDGKLSQTEIDNVKEIKIINSWSNSKVKDLTGLSLFKNLEEIIISNQSVTSIKLSSFSSLKSVILFNDQLTTLELTDMPVLESIDCSSNKLTKFNAKGCQKLKKLNCSGNKLKEGLDYFNISNSIDLEDIDLSNNQFTKIDFGSKRTKIAFLYCSNNPLTTIGFSGAKYLRELDLHETKISSFTLPDPTSLHILNVNRCYQLTFSDFSSLSNLLELHCNQCGLKTLDLSKLTELNVLECSSNLSLEKINLNNCIKLRDLSCSNTAITDLDLSKLTNLTSLYCYSNKLGTLDLRNNPNLEHLICRYCQLTSLDISKNTKLVELNCSSNYFTSLNLNSNVALETVRCDQNKLERLDVNGLSNLKKLECNANKLTSLITGNNQSLESINCSNNRLSELHVPPKTKSLICFDNPFTSVDLSSNKMLCELVTSVEPEQSSSGKSYDSYLTKYGYCSLVIDDDVKFITDVNSSSGNTSTVTIPDFAPTGTSGEQIYGFVNRLYTKVLGRDPETDGARYWATELYNFHQTGAQVAQGFIFSQEFKDRNTSNEEFVTILYNTFFGRDPETDGFNYWVGLLNSGNASREGVANGFIFSQEWADTCASYGIRSGGDIKPSGSIEPTDLTYAFVERMYTKAFKRDYDEGGRNYWASELANYNCTGEAVGVFFFISKEMNDYNLSNEEFINRLYLTFMDREGEADGKNYWIGVLNGGATRESVVYGFSRSPEFAERCITARIIPF